MESPLPTTVIIGAGPAGLTAAYGLAGAGYPVTVLEADPTYVGGISRTVRFNGFHFDIGGHRFFSKSERIEALWRELLPHDFLERPRSSRICYNGQFFAYPLRPVQALWQLGLIESARCVFSYAAARVNRNPQPRTFEEWVTNEFGERLYRIFFKTYTEKVWGMPCTEISADWAAQRIKGMSLRSAVMSALFPSRRAGIKSLIGTFQYPRLGPGMLWERCADLIKARGGQVTLGRTVVDLAQRADGQWVVGHVGTDGSRHETVADHVVSSAPLRDVITHLTPTAPEPMREAASRLQYRDFLTVALMLKDRGRFSDNWLYVHDAHVKVGRIQNFKSWSPEMVPDPALTCLGLEYFCFKGDGLWASTDADLIALATRELVQLGLADAADVIDGCVVRQPKAYPVYDDAYAERVQVIRDGLARHYPNLHLIGRNGMHKYNNQDHAMMTGLLVAENIVAGRALHDPWLVNEDAEYLERLTPRSTPVVGLAGSAGASGLRAVPTRVR